MEAFHSFWSEPNDCRNRGEIHFPDYEQLTAVLGVLEWQRHSGQIRMMTDTRGAAFFRDAGLDVFWNETLPVLDPLQGTVDPMTAWAAGKLYALKLMQGPCVMLDTDLIVWKNVSALLCGGIVAAHPEPLNPRTYPDPAAFRMKPGYRFPAEWDFSLEAANTAFLYLEDEGFRKEYAEAALDFLRHTEPDGADPVQTMCFAEQRLLPVLAAARGRQVAYLMQPGKLFSQDMLTHTWGFKQILRGNPEARREFCMRCVRRILTDFPEAEERLEACRDLRSYVLQYRAWLQKGRKSEPDPE